MTSRLSFSVILTAALMVAALPLAERMRPTIQTADSKAKIVLAEIFPEQFGQWKALPTVRPIIPDPIGEAALAATYAQTFAKSYINEKGDVVMLSVAYGRDQTSEATAVHRPEFCYSGYGFRVTKQGDAAVNLPTHNLAVRHLLAIQEDRNEPITYWVTLDESATLPGFGRKIAQLRYGLQGKVADGMLVRVSSVGKDHQANFDLQSRFVQDLYKEVPATFRSRVFGT
jgi:EpsI family protein